MMFSGRILMNLRMLIGSARAASLACFIQHGLKVFHFIRILASKVVAFTRIVIKIVELRCLACAIVATRA